MKPEVVKSWSLEIDYSRAPCLGADQKARRLWDRYWVAPRPLVFRPLVKGNEDSGNEFGQRGQDVANLRSGVPYIFCRGGKVPLIQLLDYLSVASPESGLFSDWSRNKKVLRTEP